MADKDDLRAINETTDQSGRISRREAARMLLGSVSAGAIFPWANAAHPIWHHLADDALMGSADASGKSGATIFLKADQLAALGVLAEAMVPGSTKAHVAGFIDLLLNVDSQKNRDDFLAALQAIERESSARYETKFVALTTTQRTELLTEMSTSQNRANGERTLAASAFANLKEWIGGAYYSSEIGMRELGWEPNRFFAEFPGCAQSQGHD